MKNHQLPVILAFAVLVSAGAASAEKVSFNLVDSTSNKGYGNGFIEYVEENNRIKVTNLEFNTIDNWCSYKKQNPEVSVTEVTMVTKEIQVVGLRDNCNSGKSINFEAVLLIDEPSGVSVSQAYGYITGRAGGGGPFTVGRK